MIKYNTEGINKRMVNMLILRILEEYSDDDHALTQQAILRYLKNDYNMDCDRRTVRSNIEYLIEMGYDISTKGGYRLLSRDFEESELRMLIDSVLSSRSIPVKQAGELIGKLEGMASRYFITKVSHVQNLPDEQYSDNWQVLYSVSTINDAIDQKKMIRFTYERYDTDFRLHPAQRNPREVTPYQMVVGNGRYYMVCYEEYHGRICYYRIDRMRDVAILDNAEAKKLGDVPGMENGLTLPRHMAENFYMFSGESIPILIRAKTNIVGDLIDWFGKDISILERGGEYVKVRVTCNENSAFFWALQYGQNAEVLWPESLRSKILDTLKKMTERYEQAADVKEGDMAKRGKEEKQREPDTADTTQASSGNTGKEKEDKEGEEKTGEGAEKEEDTSAGK